MRIDLLWTKLHRKHVVRVGNNVWSIRPLGTAMQPYKYRVSLNQISMNLPNEGFCRTLKEAKQLCVRLVTEGE